MQAGLQFSTIETSFLLLVGCWLVVGWLLVGCWFVVGWLLVGCWLVVVVAVGIVVVVSNWIMNNCWWS